MSLGSQIRQVFISYRRADVGALADELAQSVRSVFGKAAVFIDTGDVPAGSSWAAVLESRLERAVALLCVIGEHWTGNVGAGRRIDDPNDWVRREVRAAIYRQIPVLPIVADRAHLPIAQELPEELRPILEVQALKFEGSSAQVQDMIDWLTPHIVPPIRFVDPLTVDRESLLHAAEAFGDRLGQPSRYTRLKSDEEKRAQIESDAHACRVRQPVQWHSSLIAEADRPEVPARVRKDVLDFLHNAERRLTLMWVGLVRYGETTQPADNLLRFAALRVLRQLALHEATTVNINPPLKDARRWEVNLDRFFYEPEEIAQARVTRVSGIDVLPESELSIYGPVSLVKQSYLDSDFGRLRPLTTRWYGEYFVPQLELLLAAAGRRDMVRYDGHLAIRKIVDLDGDDVKLDYDDYA